MWKQRCAMEAAGAGKKHGMNVSSRQVWNINKVQLSRTQIDLRKKNWREQEGTGKGEVRK